MFFPTKARRNMPTAFGTICFTRRRQSEDTKNMPNYCDNSVTIVGDPHQVEQLRDRMTCQGRQGFFFDAIVPEPEWIKESDPWLEWRNQNWGDKYDGSYEYRQVEYFPGTWKLRFTTAWEPPLPVYRRLCEEYHGIRIEFFAEDGQTDWIGSGWAEWRNSLDDETPGVASDYDRLLRNIQERDDGASWFGNDVGDGFWLTPRDCAFLSRTSWLELDVGQQVLSGDFKGLSSIHRVARGWEIEFAGTATIHLSSIQFRLLLEDLGRVDRSESE